MTCVVCRVCMCASEFLSACADWFGFGGCRCRSSEKRGKNKFKSGKQTKVFRNFGKYIQWNIGIGLSVFYQYQLSIMRQPKWRNPSKTMDGSKRLRSFVVRFAVSTPLSAKTHSVRGVIALFSFALIDSFSFWVGPMKYALHT